MNIFVFISLDLKMFNEDGMKCERPLIRLLLELQSCCDFRTFRTLSTCRTESQPVLFHTDTRLQPELVCF